MKNGISIIACTLSSQWIISSAWPGLELQNVSVSNCTSFCAAFRRFQRNIIELGLHDPFNIYLNLLKGTVTRLHAYDDKPAHCLPPFCIFPSRYVRIKPHLRCCEIYIYHSTVTIATVLTANPCWGRKASGAFSQSSEKTIGKGRSLEELCCFPFLICCLALRLQQQFRPGQWMPHETWWLLTWLKVSLHTLLR
jgi:hypothetical protein